ncbi:MAG: hypothetical protein AABZ36_02060 [Nitrospirota bacterium]
MTPEEKARQKIDQLLEAGGWSIQNLKELNLGASSGIAVREFPLKSGEADYLLFVEKGGAVKFYNIFGSTANDILKEINEVLAT